MSETVVKEKLRSTLKRMNVVQDLEQVKDDDNLFAAGVLDSLTLVQYVLLLEDEFGVRIENSDIGYDQFQSFQKIILILKEKYQIS